MAKDKKKNKSKKRYVLLGCLTTENIVELSFMRRNFLTAEYEDPGFAWKWQFSKELKDIIGNKKFSKLTREDYEFIEQTIIQNEQLTSAFLDLITREKDYSSNVYH
jgi:hypothetical protein